MSELNLSRLLRPQSIAVIGGSWGRSVVMKFMVLNVIDQ